VTPAELRTIQEDLHGIIKFYVKRVRLLSNSRVHPRGGKGGAATLSKPNLMNTDFVDMISEFLCDLPCS